jgi:hypothetical protein
MSECPVVKLKLVGPHPSNPNLMLALADTYHVVVGNHYDDDTPGFFIPDGAIVPDKLADEMWVKGKLAGAKRNRVKARNLNGLRSDGLFYGARYFVQADGGKQYVNSPSWNPAWVDGQDVATEVGITFKAQ